MIDGSLLAQGGGMLRFLEANSQRIVHQAIWTGDWPPPNEFFVLFGTESGIIKIWPADEVPSEAVQAAAAHPTIISSVYRRRSASALTDDDLAEANKDKPLIFRGAEYVPAGDDA